MYKRQLLYSVQLSVTVQARDYALIISTGVLAGLCGPLLLTLMNACHRGFVSLKLAPPWQLALGGLIVGLLSLFTPAVWGNGYSTVQSFLTAPPLLMIIAGIFLCKLFAVLASSGSGAPGGVFTPTLFIGLAIGMLYGRSPVSYTHLDVYKRQPLNVVPFHCNCLVSITNPVLTRPTATLMS